jgi:hypothetical protein
MSAVVRAPALGFPPEPARPLIVAQYHAMIRAATLTEDDPVLPATS